jgi:hypothetical protein
MFIKKLKLPVSLSTLFGVVVLVAPLYVNLLVKEISPSPSINLSYEDVNEKLIKELERLESERRQWEALSKFTEVNGLRLAIKFGLRWTGAHSGELQAGGTIAEFSSAKEATSIMQKIDVSKFLDCRMRSYLAQSKTATEFSDQHEPDSRKCFALTSR